MPGDDFTDFLSSGESGIGVRSHPPSHTATEVPVRVAGVAPAVSTGTGKGFKKIHIWINFNIIHEFLGFPHRIKNNLVVDRIGLNGHVEK